MKNNSGTILMTVIVVLIFLSVIGMSLLGILFSRTILCMMEIERVKAFYLAEAGIARSIYELRKNTDLDNNGIGNIAWMEFGDGKLAAQHDFATSTITAQGEVNTVKRTVQVKYTVY